MKSIFLTVIATVIYLATATFSAAESGSSQTVLTSFDFDVVGVSLTASPAYQAVPKGIASRVNTAFEAAGFDLAALVDKLPQDYKVLAELIGPAFPQAKTLETKPGVPFDLPTLALTGRYTLANIRLVDGSGNTLFGSLPQLVAIESIPDPLITSVTTRQLTVQELQERGVTFDKSNFTAYEFTAGIATSSGQVPIKLPVIIPTSQIVQETPDIQGASTISLPQPQTFTVPPEVPETAIPPNLEVHPVMMEVQETEKVGKLQLPPIPGVIVIPGNIGFLHQYFSALALVTNGAPLQSGLSIRDVRASVSFPPGEDMVYGEKDHPGLPDEYPGDDPLRMAKGTNGFFPRTMAVMNSGPDGKAGTADDVGVMQPGESGQADFTIEGMKEGTHKVDFDITATLDGLPIGPVTLKGKATGAILVRNPDFAVTMGHPATVRAGEEYDLFITVTNTGKSMANLVTVNLDPRAISGAAFVAGEANSKSIDTILPGSAATVKFRLKSQRTGKVTATAFESPEIKGRFVLRTGVGENGIPLSPDSLILPYTGTLPSDLVTSAVGLLGQAWSVATAPAGALPASVLPIGKSIITARAYDLSEAGLRILIGDNQVRAVEDFTFDFFGSDVYNKGFDSLRRSSTMGLELNRAIAAIFKTEIDAIGALSFQTALADKVSYRSGHLSVINTDAPLRMRLTDATGNRSGSLDATVASRGIPYADSFAIGENGISRSNLILATRIDSPSYTLDLAADSAASFDLGILLPDNAGVLTRYSFSGLSLPAGATASVTIVNGGSDLKLSIDDNNDGVIDRTIAPSSVAAISDHAPHLVAATQLTPGFGPGGDKHGRNVAVLFSERVSKENAQLAANYSVDENMVKQATLQPGGRMAFLLLRDGIGPFFARNLTVQGLTDPAGKSMSQSETLPVRITATGPAAVVTGTVRTARGEPVPNATIRLYQLVWHEEFFVLEERYALFTEKQANSDGSYRLEYVLQNDDPPGPFKIEAVNPVTGEVGSLTTGVIYHGQRLQLDIFMKAKGALAGVVRNEAGNPVSGATVQVITLADNRGKSMITDASGAYSFTGLMVGAYSLKAVSQTTASEGSLMGILPEDGTSVSQDLTIRKVGDAIRGTVSGKIIGADGVTPRSGVIVILKGNNYQNWMRSAADGSFSFSGVFAGNVTVTARDDGTGEQSESGGSIATQGQNITLNVIMKGTGTVVGTVTRDDKKSAAGLYVVARPPSPAQARVLQTDTAGAFRIENLPTGNVSIEIIDPNDFNRTVATGTVTILAAGETANIALFVPLKAMATGTIKGTVYHRNGTSLWANAPLMQVVDSTHYIKRTVGEDGEFSIPNLPLGSYNFSVVGGNEVINISTDLWYDTQVRTLELHPVAIGSVTGTTYDDAEMKSPTGADVTIYSTKPNLVGWLVYGSDPIVVKSDPVTGRFTFNSILQGSFTVSSSNIFRPTPVSVSGKIETEGQVVNVNLPLKGTQPKPGDPPPVNQPGSVSGKVLMPDGTVPGKIILSDGTEINREVKITITFGDTSVTVTTDDQGHFQFAPLIPAGNHTVTAEEPVSTLKWQGSVYVPSGLDVPITIKLLGRGTVTVKVLDGEGREVPNADITGAAISIVGVNYPFDKADGGITSTSSQAVFANLSEGNYAVSVSATGNRSILSGRGQVFIPGDNANITVVVSLAHSATVTGRFLKADGVNPITTGGQITLKRNGQVIAYTSSSSDGLYRFEYIPLGDFVVEGYDPVTERRGTGGGRLSTNGEIVSADVVVTPRGTVKGLVLNYGGSSPVGASPITINFGGGSYSSVTAPDGSFLFTGIPASRFSLDATDPSNGLHGQTSGSLSYENETVTSQVRIAPTGSISGRVLMPDGLTPLTIATVYLNGGSPQAVDSVTGIFRYDNLAAGKSYTLSTSVPGTYRTGSTIATISRDLEVANGDITLGGLGTVSGTVREYGPDNDQTLIPLYGAVVKLYSGGGVELASASTLEDGSFSFSGMPTGSFTLKASHALRATGASQSGYLAREGETVAKELVLGPVGVVNATVVLADGVTPSRAGGIRITTTNGSVTNSYTGVTDSNGKYKFSGIPVPCSVALDVEDSAGVGIGRFFGVLDEFDKVLDTGVIVLDDKPIFVTGINPASGAVNVPVNQSIRILFSEPADPSTLNSSNIYLTQGTTRVSGSLQIDADNSGVTFIPASPLKGFTLYTLVVSAGVKDRVWRNLAQAQSVSFTTIDNIPPTVTSISPAGGTIEIATDAVPRVSFSEPLDPASLDNVKLYRNGIVVETRTDLIQGGMVVALTPLASLSANGNYTISISGVRDLVGNTLAAPASSSFATIDIITPTIGSLTYPAGSDLIKGNLILITPQTADTDIAFVDYFVENILVKTVSSAPYAMAYTLPAAGVVHLKAIAQDKVGNRGFPAILELPVAADQSPEVVFASPADSSQVNTGSTFSVVLQGTDDLSLKEITLTLSGEMNASQTKPVTGKNGSATFTFTAPTGITGSGAIILTATAKDSGNNTTVPIVRTITLHDSIAPAAVSATSPGSNTLYKPGETGTASFVFSDNIGITSVTCATTGAVTTSQSFVIEPPQKNLTQGFSFAVPAAAVSGADINITCTASDSSANQTAKVIILKVADIVAPTVDITAPADNSSIGTGQTFNVDVQASDDLLAKEITLVLRGEMNSVVTRQSGSGKTYSERFSFTAPMTIVQGGNIQIAATAKDSSGNISSQATRSITLKDVTPPQALSLASQGLTTFYKPGATGTATFTVSDNMGVASITCSATGAANGSSTYSFNPPQANVTQPFDFQVSATAAPYAAMNITCAAADAASNTTQKSLSLTVADIVPPTVTGASIIANSTNVPTNAAITVNFSETLLATTVNSSSVALTEAVSGQAVGGNVALSSDRKSVTFTPQSLLTVGKAYRFAIASTVFSEATGSTYAMSSDTRNRILVEAIPARTLAAGKQEVSAFNKPGSTANFDMQSNYKNGWPVVRTRKNDYRWLHNDFINISLPYVLGLFDAFVAKGALK